MTTAGDHAVRFVLSTDLVTDLGPDPVIVSAVDNCKGMCFK